MVLIYDVPFLSAVLRGDGVVDEVAALAVTAVPFFDEGVTAFGLVGPIGLHIYS